MYSVADRINQKIYGTEVPGSSPAVHPPSSNPASSDCSHRGNIFVRKSRFRVPVHVPRSFSFFCDRMGMEQRQQLMYYQWKSARPSKSNVCMPTRRPRTRATGPHLPVFIRIKDDSDLRLCNSLPSCRPRGIVNWSVDAATITLKNQGSRIPMPYATAVIPPTGVRGSQESAFKNIVTEQMLEQFLVHGRDINIIAYGTSGSGKTYTLFGAPGCSKNSSDGIISRLHGVFFRCGMAVLSWIQQQYADGSASNTPGSSHYSLTGSCIEIQSTRLSDLMRQNKECSMGESWQETVDGQPTYHVRDAQQIPLGTVDDLMEMGQRMAAAFENRVRHNTSCGSHVMTTLTLSVGEVSREINLFDLIGSKKPCAKTAAQYRRLKRTQGPDTLQNEGVFLNFDLQLIENCARKISNGGRLNDTSFRDSNVTKLLWKTFVHGRAFSAMVICVSLSPTISEETYNSILYGSLMADLPVAAEPTGRSQRNPGSPVAVGAKDSHTDHSSACTVHVALPRVLKHYYNDDLNHLRFEKEKKEELF